MGALEAVKDPALWEGFDEVEAYRRRWGVTKEEAEQAVAETQPRERTPDTIPYLSCADTAKLVRARLKLIFPGVKFSVRSSVYSGGASISVGWTDGPTEKAVDRVVQPYGGASFDGMIDLQSYHTSVVIIDGEEVQINSGADWIHTRRTYSPELLAEVEKLADQSLAKGPTQCRLCAHTFDEGFYGQTSRKMACSKECYARMEAQYTDYTDGILMQEEDIYSV